MEKVEIKVTWGFTWALLWRMMLIGLGVYAVLGIITLVVALIIGDTTFIPFLGG